MSALTIFFFIWCLEGCAVFSFYTLMALVWIIPMHYWFLQHGQLSQLQLTSWFDRKHFTKFSKGSLSHTNLFSQIFPFVQLESSPFESHKNNLLSAYRKAFQFASVTFWCGSARVWRQTHNPADKAAEGNKRESRTNPKHIMHF